jgi:ribosomal protein S15P/S13E
MKIDELLKHLENVKTDEDEKRKITEYIAQIFTATGG